MFTLFIILCLVTIVIGCLVLILGEKVVIKGINFDISKVSLWILVLIVVWLVLLVEMLWLGLMRM